VIRGGFGSTFRRESISVLVFAIMLVGRQEIRNRLVFRLGQR
jgi:hypothetical protein